VSDTPATELIHAGGVSGDPRRPWFARLYYAVGVAKPYRPRGASKTRQAQVGGLPAISVTNATRDGLQMDIDAGLARADIGRIEWGGPPGE
jgi:hypothetical protein